MVAPFRPPRTYLSGLGPAVVMITDRITLGVVITSTVDDISYQATRDEYISKKRTHNYQLENWDDINANEY